MKITKKFFVLVFTLVLIISTVPIVAKAYVTTGKCGDNVTWSFDNATHTLTISGTGDMYNYENSSDTPWHKESVWIREVSIIGSVTSIGDGAFENLVYITRVSINSQVTKIGERAFYNCSRLYAINIPNSVTEIGAEAFYGCSGLKEIEIPESVTEIGATVFQECVNLLSITIPNSISKIERYAFPQFAIINYNGTKEQWKRFVEKSNSHNYYYRVLCSDGRLNEGACGDDVIWSWDENTGTLTISGTGDMYNYTRSKISPWQYITNSITVVDIKDGVTVLPAVTAERRKTPVLMVRSGEDHLHKTTQFSGLMVALNAGSCACRGRDALCCWSGDCR